MVESRELGRPMFADIGTADSPGTYTSPHPIDDIGQGLLHDRLSRFIQRLVAIIPQSDSSLVFWLTFLGEHGRVLTLLSPQ